MKQCTFFYFTYFDLTTVLPKLIFSMISKYFQTFIALSIGVPNW